MKKSNRKRIRSKGYWEEKRRGYITGLGFLSVKKEKYYLKDFLERDTINVKEYKRFKRVLEKLEKQHIAILSHKSIVEKILLKYNSPQL